MILPLEPGLAGVISRITPEDGAEWVRRDDEGLAMEYGPLRDDWVDICEQTAAWLQAEFNESYREHGLWPDDRERERLLHKAIAYRQELLRLNTQTKRDVK